MFLKKLALFGVFLLAGASFCAPLKPDYSLVVKRGMATSDVVIALPGGSLFMGDMKTLDLYTVPAINLCYALSEQVLVSHNPALRKVAREFRNQLEAYPNNAVLHAYMSVFALAVLITAGYDLDAKSDVIFESMKNLSLYFAPSGKTIGFDEVVFNVLFQKLHGVGVREVLIELNEKVEMPAFDKLISSVDALYPSASAAVREYRDASQAALDLLLELSRDVNSLQGEVTQARLMAVFARANYATQGLLVAFGLEKLGAKLEGTQTGSTFNVNMSLAGLPFNKDEFIGSYFGFSKRWDFDAVVVQPKVIAWVSQENVQSPVAWYDIEKNTVYTDLPVVVADRVSDDNTFVTGSMQRDADGALTGLCFDSNVVVAGLQDGADLIQSVLGQSSNVVSFKHVSVGCMKAYDNDLTLNANIIQVPACAQRFIVSCKPCGTDVTSVVNEEYVVSTPVNDVMVIEENAVSSTGATESAPSEDVSA